MTTMRDEALALARAGFKVFPITPLRNAPPLITAWQLAATSGEELIDEWWATWPNANIGIHCDGLIVIDVDVKSGGEASLAALRDMFDVPPTRIASTPGGGWHLYFKSDVPSKNRVGNVFGPGIDLRSKNGYVVAPPSVRKDGKYEWSQNGTIAEAPQWLKDAAPAGKEIEKPVTPQAPVVDVKNPSLAEQQARNYLVDLPAAQEGQRDHLAYRAACQCRDFGMSQYDTQALMTAEWKCEPPLTDSELTHAVASAFKYAQNPPATLAAETWAKPVPEEPAATKTTKRRRLHPSQIVRANVQLRPYIVKGLLSPNSKAEIFGRWGSGKTFNLLSLGAHVALGLEWFSHRVRQTGVLNLLYEGEDAMALRLLALIENVPDLAKPGTAFACELMTKNVLSPGGRDQAHEALHDFKREFGAYPGLVIVDPLRNAIGDKEDAEHIGPYIEWTNSVRAETRACVLTAHHPGYGATDRGRGDSGLEGDMDTVLKVDGDARTIEAMKQRDGVKSAFGYDLQIVTLGIGEDGDDVTSCVAVARDLNDGVLPKMERRVYDAAIATKDNNDFITRQAVKDAAGFTHTAKDKRAFDGAWHRLQNRHLIINLDKRYKVHVVDFGVDEGEEADSTDIFG